MPISQRERDEVILIKHQLDTAREVWQPLKEDRRVYQEMLRNRFPRLLPGNTMGGLFGDDQLDQDQINVNLSSRVVAYVRSKCFDSSPEIRISGMHDQDIELSNMNEHLVSRVMERGRAPEASREAINDMATLGSWIVWMGIDTYAIDHRRLAGFSTEVSSVVLAAAQGADVHPLPGMDLLMLASTARNVHAQSPWTLTDFEKLNLLRLATEAEDMFKEEQNAPQPLQAKKIWYRAVQYGSGCLIDPRVWDKQDATWMARRIIFGVDQFRAWEPFKPGLRRNANPQTLTPDSGHQRIEPTLDGVGHELNECFDVWEIWNRQDFSVHYVCDSVEGYLEKDSSYPYLGQDGQPYFDDFFPCEWATPYQHNLLTPDRPMGEPLLSYCLPQQLEIIKFESAIVADAKRSARMYEHSPGIDPDSLAGIKNGMDGTMVEKNMEDHLAGRPSIVPLANPPMGQDKLIARNLATQDFFSLASVAPSQITGSPVAQTLGQEELITRGAGDIQGDVVSMVQVAYSNLARKTAALIRHNFTNTEIMRYLDRQYITPVVDQKTGEQVKPAPYEIWKAESLDGVDITASFATKGDAEDPAKIAQLLQILDIVLSTKDSAGIPYKDPKALIDLLIRRAGLGVIPDYTPSQNEMIIRALQNSLQARAGQAPVAPGVVATPGGGPAPRTGTARSNRRPNTSNQAPIQGPRPIARDMTKNTPPPRPE